MDENHVDAGLDEQILPAEPLTDTDPVEDVDPEPFCANGVSFDGLHSYAYFGMWLEVQPNKGVPEPYLNIVEVPGMDGYLDMTEANSGEIKFGNREMVLTFVAQVSSPHDRSVFREFVANALHGKRFERIKFDDEADWHYSGRASVAFEDVSAWKDRCIVTVDAKPYAMKDYETLVEIGTNESASIQLIQLASENVAKEEWNSDLRLGSKAFPDGIVPPWNASQQLILRWQPRTFHVRAPSINISDSDGHTYTINFNVTEAGGEYRVLLSDIENANVVLSKVYRVFVRGVNNCKLFWEARTKKDIVVNSRKSVVPTIYLSSYMSEPIQIVVNGKNYEIEAGEAVYDEIVLREGKNEIMSPELNVIELTMRFREGRL